MADLPEEYLDPYYRRRIYYGNRCNLCFHLHLEEAMKKCAGCLAVVYCSREHQLEDWPAHKQTCVAFRKVKAKVKLPGKLDRKSFFIYRSTLATRLAEFRKFPDSSYLSDYEYQMCMLPCVCAVCFVSPEEKYLCDVCFSVVYCSAEHLRGHMEEHKSVCDRWKNVLNHSEFVHRNINKVHNIRYRPIGRRTQVWPNNRYDLWKFIQSKNIPKSKLTSEHVSELHMFLEPYLPACMIISCMESGGFVKNRELVRKDKQNKRMRTMTIHFATADEYEISFNWDKISQLLFDWIRGINKIQFIITGSRLKHCKVPTLHKHKRIEIKIFEENYHKCINLPNPDVIIMLECSRAPWILEPENALNEKFVGALFKHKNKPLIFCDGRIEFMIKLLWSLLARQRTYKFKSSTVTRNVYREFRILRTWDEKMGIFERNQYLLNMISK